jgi:hypothetical protein
MVAQHQQTTTQAALFRIQVVEVEVARRPALPLVVLVAQTLAMVVEVTHPARLVRTVSLIAVVVAAVLAAFLPLAELHLVTAVQVR